MAVTTWVSCKFATASKTALKSIAGMFFILVVLLASSGCVKVKSNTIVEENGSGTFRIEVILGEEVLRAVEPVAGKPEAVQATILRNFRIGDIGATWSNAQVVAPDEGIGFVLSADFADYREIGPALTGGTSPFFEFLDITHSEDGSWSVEAKPGRLEKAPLPSQVVRLSQEQLDRLPKPEYTVSLTFPGSLSSNNATSIDGNTASWTFTGDSPEMSANWSHNTNSSLFIIVVLVTIASVVVTGYLYFGTRKKSLDA